MHQRSYPFSNNSVHIKLKSIICKIEDIYMHSFYFVKRSTEPI